MNNGWHEPNHRESVFAEDPHAVVLGELEVSTVSGEELQRASRLLEEEHYLGAARSVGRTLGSGGPPRGPLGGPAGVGGRPP